MKLSILDSNSILLMQKGLDFTWQRQKVITENIANSETPGYKSKYVTFEDELKKRVKSAKNGTLTQKNEILNSNYRTNFTNNESTKLDGNNVNVDEENVELVRTYLQYEYLSRLINDEFSKMNIAIKGQ